MAERRPPVDKYSKSAYEAGLAQLSETEDKTKKHPLQAELDMHQELRKDAPSHYPLVEDEERARDALEKETAGFRREVEEIKRDLWRQLGNAQTEAAKTNDELKSGELAREVLPKIIKIEDRTHHQMEDTGNLSLRAQYFGRAVLDEAEDARHRITSKKPTLAPETIQTSFNVVEELYRQFAGLAGNVLLQNKYGGDASGSAAT